MKRSYLAFVLISLCLTCASPGVRAQQGVYTLEMVVFEQPPSGDSERLHIETSAEAAPANTAGSLNLGGKGITVLPGRKGQLVPVVYTLNRKGARVLAHLRWRQHIARSHHNPWYAVRGKNLAGRIRINRGRYLHLDTDLTFSQSGHEYHMREKARMRSGKLYYIDHPKLGVLFLAQRWVDPNAPKPATQKQTPSQTQTPQPAPQVPATDNPPEQRKPAGELPRATPDNS
jgi:hypothetical protein